MSASVITFPQTERAQSATIITNGDRRAAVAAERTGRNAKEIERLPFDLSVLEEEGLFVNVDATGFGILDRRLDWQALGVELPEETDVAFRPPRCGLLPNRYRRPLLTPVSQSHAALHKYSYHFRLTETLFESPAYRWVPWQAFTEFETVFNKACDNLNKAKQTVLDAYDGIRDEVVAAFSQVAADSARRLAATNAPSRSPPRSEAFSASASSRRRWAVSNPRLEPTAERRRAPSHTCSTGCRSSRTSS